MVAAVEDGDGDQRRQYSRLAGNRQHVAPIMAGCRRRNGWNDLERPQREEEDREDVSRVPHVASLAADAGSRPLSRLVARPATSRPIRDDRMTSTTVALRTGSSISRWPAALRVE